MALKYKSDLILGLHFPQWQTVLCPFPSFPVILSQSVSVSVREGSVVQPVSQHALAHCLLNKEFTCE